MGGCISPFNQLDPSRYIRLIPPNPTIFPFDLLLKVVGLLGQQVYSVDAIGPVQVISKKISNSPKTDNPIFNKLVIFLFTHI